MSDDDPTTIDRHMAAVHLPLALLAGMRLDLFTPLGEGPMTAAALAGALGVEARRLEPLLFMLVNARLLTVEGDRFANTAEADRFLVRGRPGFRGDGHALFADLIRASLATADSIRAAAPRMREDPAAMSPAERDAYLRILHPGALAAGRDFAVNLEFGECRRLLDAGGGSGGVAIAACELCSDLRAVVAEHTDVAPHAARFVADAELADRVAVEACDLTETAPDGPFDIAVLRNVLQVLAPEAAARVVANVGAALEPGGWLYVVEFVLDDDRLAPLAAAAVNMVFVNYYDRGRAHTESDHRGWLAAAGFDSFERIRLARGYSAIAARKGSQAARP